MIKNLVKLLALSSGLVVATPAFAKVYIYGLADESKLTIDTTSKTGSLVSKDGKTNLSLTGSNLSQFTGTFLDGSIENKNYFNLTQITGTIGGEKINWKYVTNKSIPRILFDFDPVNSKSKHVKLTYYTKTGPYDDWGAYKDYSYGVKSEAVPEPENVVLLLLGFGGLYLSSRKRKGVNKPSAFSANLQPA